VRSRIACLVLLFSVSSVAFAADQKCVSPDRNFSSFFQKFQKNARFRMSRVFFPLATESENPGAREVIHNQELIREADVRSGRVVIPSLSLSDAEKALRGTNAAGAFSYRLTIGLEKAELSVTQENTILSGQQYDFTRKNGCWFLSKMGFYASS
jgi:hypothetical protein